MIVLTYIKCLLCYLLFFTCKGVGPLAYVVSTKVVYLLLSPTLWANVGYDIEFS